MAGLATGFTERIELFRRPIADKRVTLFNELPGIATVDIGALTWGKRKGRFTGPKKPEREERGRPKGKGKGKGEKGGGKDRRGRAESWDGWDRS